MDPKLRLALSPIAFATVLALAGAVSLVSTPWLPLSAAEASHCNPPPSCDSSCNCDCACNCNCDCAGCGGLIDLPETYVP
jgi:hypothetical protein